MGTYLVTGAAGFIGSHTCDSFLRDGDTVIGLDNLNDYYDPARKRANVEEVRAGGHPGEFHFVHGDVRDRALLEKIASEHSLDAIVHLAAMAGVRASVEDPHLYYDVNLIGTLNLLEIAKAGDIHMAFAGTSSAYGRTEVVPFIESDAADRPLAPYSASKRGAELLAHSYHHLHGNSFTALRFFTVYGPRGRPDMMAYKVLDNIYEGREVPLYNGGEMYRDWTYISDIVAGVTAAARTRLGYEIINLGRGEPVLLSDFIHMIEALTGKPSNLKTEPMPAADIQYTYANIDKAKRLLGYDPKVSVADGVERFVNWYMQAVRGR